MSTLPAHLNGLSGFPDDLNDAGDWVVRPLAERDVAAVAGLSRAGLLPGYSGEEFDDPAEIGRRYVATRRCHFWVAELGGRVVGTVALAEVRRDVGQVRWLRVARPPGEQLCIAKRLLRVAASFAREVGFLKLTAHMPAASRPPVVSFLRSLGFEYSRSSRKDGRDTMEFYLNLYQNVYVRRESRRRAAAPLRAPAN